MIARNLLPTKLKKLLCQISVSTYAYTTKSISNPIAPILETSIEFENHNPKTSPFLFSSRHFSTKSHRVSPLTRDGNYDDKTSQIIQICPGCGVHMQESDITQPGHFIRPSTKKPDYNLSINRNPVAEEFEVSDSFKKGLFTELVESENLKHDDVMKQKESPEKPVVCTRCHTLRNYGRVKDPSVENLLPSFDFDHTVGRRLMSINVARTVVLMIVDVSDFDGSFPRTVASLVARTVDENSWAWKSGKSGNVPRVVLVVTKIDLLPSSISPSRLEHWVRTRARVGGVGKLTSVHLVSAVKDWGVKNLFDDVVGLAGPRGHVWAVGAQNAGKSTLINAIGKCVGGKLTHLTEAPVPGTTLGIVRVEGVLPRNAKLFDTPGLVHPYQIPSRLNREEQKLVHISKELKPRTYRIKAGYSIHIGGLVRLDLEELSVDSAYITVWASPFLPLHMGKTEHVSTMIEDHFGRQLQPPIGEERVHELGCWVKKECRVTGHWWDYSSEDIAIAGLGWFAIGLKGEAVLGVWTYEGFTTSKIVSQADRKLNKNQRKEEKKKKKNDSSTPSITTDSVLQRLLTPLRFS
ncbi:hypothetical protein Leryth_006589 [Lithospermum erythrorhizon]|nr:hypothetical protein Leryth_006589 [Lithospermum erythrorhizon]